MAIRNAIESLVIAELEAIRVLVVAEKVLSILPCNSHRLSYSHRPVEAAVTLPHKALLTMVL